jgi:hypothetical protein
MASNTKLTPQQKIARKTYLYTAGAMDIQVLNNGETTIAFRPMGNTVEFSLSVMGPDERKFRRKVGEYYALLRFFHSGETVKMKQEDFEVMCEEVFEFYL